VLSSLGSTQPLGGLLLWHAEETYFRGLEENVQVAPEGRMRRPSSCRLADAPRGPRKLWTNMQEPLGESGKLRCGVGEKDLAGEFCGVPERLDGFSVGRVERREAADQQRGALD